MGSCGAKTAHQVVCVGLKLQMLESLPCSVVAWGLPGRGAFLAPKLGHCIWRLSSNCIPYSQGTQSLLKKNFRVHLYGYHDPQIIFLQPRSTFEEISLYDTTLQLSFIERLSSGEYFKSSISDNPPKYIESGEFLTDGEIEAQDSKLTC